MFHELNTLLTLNLSSNEIVNMSYNSFWSQKELNVLDLSSNKLVDIRHEWFKNLHNLRTLIMRQNKLAFLSNLVFSPLSKLHILDLSRNCIKSMGLLTFKGLLNLQFLNISSNNVSELQNGVFRSLESLKTLDISENSFMSIDNVFLHTIHLQTLYMRKLSHFKALTSSSFAGLKEMKSFDLSGSEVVSVNLKTFSHTPNIKHLDLSNMKLTTLQMGTFNNLKKIEIIELKGNPWKCDCYLYWLLLWLGEHSNAHLLFPSETFCHSPANLIGHVLLDALDHNMICTNASILHYTNRTKFKVGSPAYLECQVDGNPPPNLTWITPQKMMLHWISFKNSSDQIPASISFHSTNYQLLQGPINEKTRQGRFFIMPNGSLGIQNVERGDGGFYICVASNPLNYDSISIRLTLDYDYFEHIKIVSVLVGMATSFGFLLLTLVSILIKMILKHFGIKCPCRSGSASPRTQQIKKILESMEHYKKQQLDRLRDNYNVQVQRIKDNCMQQMERLRESYSSQAERLRDIKEYGTLQIDRIRENYYSQVQRVRDYSASQIIRLRENYIFQRNRIRKFSAHQLYKLRENYKLQQQHLNKILENLNIESCRNVCQRTDSVIFEPEITLENVLVPKICLQTFAKETCDSNDNSSQVSAYFTPDDIGSEVSSHESDEHESLDITAVQTVSKTDTIVKLDNKEIDNIPSTSSHLDTVCNQKSSNETLV
ncbi:hypothetical protein X975_09457, partial [Stegodyphus mimosarum]